MERHEDRPAAYEGSRNDIVALASDLPAGAVVVDVGCSTGELGGALKTDSDLYVVGIEADAAAATAAKSRLDRVVHDDALSGLISLRDAMARPPDLVVFADVLEHLHDPWATVDAAVALMPHGGHILASIPNIAFYDTFYNLLRGTWPRRARGIHDSSHVQFFARNDVIGIMSRERCSIVEMRRNFRLFEHTARFARVASVIGRAWPNVLTYQYLVRSRVEPAADR